MAFTAQQIKICGITNLDDALFSAQTGANYLGYILNYKKSARYIPEQQAEKIIKNIRLNYPSVQHVGVFVNESTEIINRLVINLNLDIIQLHGNESVSEILDLNGIKKWKAIEIKQKQDVQKISIYDDIVDGILLDAGKGSGKTMNFELLDHISMKSSLIIAGGITPDNIVSIRKQFHPNIIDVNSGVESLPGQKDHYKITKLFNNITI